MFPICLNAYKKFHICIDHNNNQSQGMVLENFLCTFILVGFFDQHLSAHDCLCAIHLLSV